MGNMNGGYQQQQMGGNMGNNQAFNNGMVGGQGYQAAFYNQVGVGVGV